MAVPLLGLLLGLCLPTFASPAPAAAARAVTWSTPSPYVAPDQILENDPPPGALELAPALRVNVLLPDGYRRGGPWPVLYLLHGHGDRFDSWLNPERGNVRQLARHFPAIIVMPEAGQGWYTNWWNRGVRGEPAWEDYYLRQLIPLVNRRLDVRDARRWHAIAGFSMGGEGALYFAEQLPAYFGSVASFSGALSIQRPEWPTAVETQGQHYEDVFGPADGFYATGHNPTALAANVSRSRVFVTVGDGVPNPASPDETTNTFGALAETVLRQHAQDFLAGARDAGADVTYDPRQGIHDWPYWRQALSRAIDWGFFRPVLDAPPSWTFRTVALSGNAWGIAFKFSAPPESVERLALRNGRVLAGTGSQAATLRTPSGCRLVVDMPGGWRTRLPAGWRRAPRTPAQRRQASRDCRAVRVKPAGGPAGS